MKNKSFIILTNISFLLTVKIMQEFHYWIVLPAEANVQEI